MKVSRLFFSCAFFLVASAPAHAHGGGLAALVVMMSTPLVILIFLPICALSGMVGRRWKAFGLYLVALVVTLVLQWQEWYRPIARMFPEPVWMQDRLRFVLIPPLDLLLCLALAVIAIYLVLRDRTVPVGLARPVGNVLWGSLFSITAVALWSYVLFDPGVTARIREWPTEIKGPFFVVWAFFVPIVLTFTAIHLFRRGPPRLRRRSSR